MGDACSGFSAVLTRLLSTNSGRAPFFCGRVQRIARIGPVPFGRRFDALHVANRRRKPGREKRMSAMPWMLSQPHVGWNIGEASIQRAGLHVQGRQSCDERRHLAVRSIAVGFQKDLATRTLTVAETEDHDKRKCFR